MKVKLIIFTLMTILMSGIQVYAQDGGKKILVVYFSHSGNTRAVAYDICKKTDGVIFEIKTVKPYPDDYQTVVDIARKELDTDYRPALQSFVKDIQKYDIIFLGYPNWWTTYPQAVKVFLSKHDLSNKVIIPFCTHEGSGLGRSMEDMKKTCPKSNISQGIAIRGSNARRVDEEIEIWLKKLKIIK